MKHFKQYLEAVKKQSKNNNPTISDIDRNNLKKIKDEDLFKSSYGFIRQYPGDPGKWIWPANEKVR